MIGTNVGSNKKEVTVRFLSSVHQRLDAGVNIKRSIGGLVSRLNDLKIGSLLFLLVVLYVVVVLVLSRLNCLSLQAISALSLPFIFLIPLRLGEIIYPSLGSLAETIDNLEALIRIGVVWSIGMLALFLVATVISLLVKELLVLFDWIILATALTPFRWMKVTSAELIKDAFKVSARNVPFWLSIVCATAFYLIPRLRFLPFPMLGGASYGEVFSVIRFQDVGTAGIGYGHPTVIEPLLSSIASFLSIHPIFLFNVLSYVIPLVYGYIVLSVVQKIVPGTIGAVSAPFLALFVITSESFRCFTQHDVLYIFILLILLFAFEQRAKGDISLPFFFYGIILALIGGGIIAATLFLNAFILNVLIVSEFVAIILIIHTKLFGESSNLSSLFWGFWCGIWPMLLHEFEGILLSGLVLITTLFASRKNKRLLLVITITIFCYWFSAQYFQILQFDNNNSISSFFLSEEALSFPRVGFFDKLGILWSDAPEVFLFAFLFSIPVAFYMGNDKIHSILFASIVSLGLFFFPESLFVRFDKFWAITGVVVVACSLSLVVSYVKESKLSLKMRFLTHSLTFSSRKTEIATQLLIGLFAVSAIGSMVAFRFDWIEKNLNEQGVYSHTRTYEMKTALWLRGRVKEIYKPTNFFDTSGASKFLVLSDPYTMLLMHSWSGCSQLADESCYIYSSSYSQNTKDQWNELKRELFLTKNETSAFAYLADESKRYMKVYVVISHRTILWMQHDSEYFILSKHWSLEDRIGKMFYMAQFLEVVYEIDNSIVVYGLN